MSVTRIASLSQLTDSYAEHAEYELTQKSLTTVDILRVRYVHEQQQDSRQVVVR